jgi:hypothetical protein
MAPTSRKQEASKATPKGKECGTRIEIYSKLD